MQVAYRSAAAKGTVTNKSFHKSLANTTSTMANYNLHTIQGTQSTTQFNQTLKNAASWTKQMGIGLYVVGGAATQIARPLMALSMIFNTYQQMSWSSARIERWVDAVGQHFKWLRGRIAGFFSAINTHVRNGIAALLRYAKTLPVVGTAVRSLMATIRSINWAVMFSWIGIIAGALVGLGMAAKKLSKKFQPVSEHIQRAISVSSIAQDQFDALTNTIFELQRALGVFTTEEIANMVERMAYAGAIGEQFKETAMSIGQIAYVTGMDMAEITRDMARLTSQTGEEYEELANVILRTFAQASITYEETVESFQQAGMLLREDLGMSVEHLGAIVVQLEKFGYTGTRAATAIRSLAARSSELREGLRGSQEIFKELGVTDAVEQFKAGEIALDELIMTFGEAGASYGHMVNIFNRRAGVAAAAIAEFSDDYEEATARITDSTTEVTKMFDDLKNSYQGVQDQAEAARSRATQQWGYTFKYIGKIVTSLNASIWDSLANLGRISRQLPSVFSIALNAVRLAADGIDRTLIGLFNMLSEFVSWLIKVGEWAAKIIPGVSAKPVTDTLNAIQKQQEKFRDWSNKRLARHRDSLMGAVEDIKEGVPDLEATAEVEYNVEQFEAATEKYKEGIGSNLEALKEFRDALHPEFLKKLGQEVLSLATGLEFAKESIDSFADSLEDTIDRMFIRMGEVDYGKVFGQASQQMGRLMTDFVRLSETSTYLEKKFKDVTDELEDMFGLTRAVQRRHAAKTRGTGEVVGQAYGEPGGGGGETQRLLKDMLGDSYDTMKNVIKNFRDFSGEFTPIMLELLQEEGAQSMEDVWQKLIEKIMPEQEIDFKPSEQAKEIRSALERVFEGDQAEKEWESFSDNQKDIFKNLSDKINEGIDALSKEEAKKLLNVTGHLSDLSPRLREAILLEQETVDNKIDVPSSVEGLGGNLNQTLTEKYTKEDMKRILNLGSGLESFSGDINETLKSMGIDKEDLSPGVQKYLEKWMEGNKQAGEYIKNQLSDESEGFWSRWSERLSENMPAPPETQGSTNKDSPWWMKVLDWITLSGGKAYAGEEEGKRILTKDIFKNLSDKINEGIDALSAEEAKKLLDVANHLSDLSPRLRDAIVLEQQTVDDKIDAPSSIKGLGDHINQSLTEKYTKEDLKRILNLGSGLENFSGDINETLKAVGIDKEDLTPAAQSYIDSFKKGHKEAGKNFAEKFKSGFAKFWDAITFDQQETYTPPKSVEEYQDLPWWKKLLSRFKGGVRAYGAETGEGETTQDMQVQVAVSTEALSGAFTGALQQWKPLKSREGGRMQPNKLAGAMKDIVKSLSKIKGYLSAIDTNIDEGIDRSEEKIKKTINKTTNNVDVKIDQKFDNSFEWSVEGGEANTATKETVKRAIDRAIRELENSVRSTVDPDALERMIIERIDDEVAEGNGENSESSGGGAGTEPMQYSR